MVSDNVEDDLFEVWIKRRGEQRYLPECWFFEETTAKTFANALRMRGMHVRVLYNVTCRMPDWKPPRQMR